MAGIAIVDVHVMHPAGIGADATFVILIQPRQHLAVFAGWRIEVRGPAVGMLAATSCARNHGSGPVGRDHFDVTEFVFNVLQRLAQDGRQA
jgi:hypothetical protein